MTSVASMTTRRFFHSVEYKGVWMLFQYTYDGDEIALIAQAEISGLGMVSSVVECDAVGMTGPEAAYRWLSELGEEDYERFYKEVRGVFVMYGGE